MAEEITDLTDDGEPAEEAGKGKKKAKAPKEPKAAKEGKDPAAAKGEKKAKKEKGGSAGGVIIIMILILLILLGGFGAVLYLDMFDARMIVAEVVTEPLLDVIIWLDPGYSTIRQRLRNEEEMQERRFAERTENLDTREENILFHEELLDSREQQVQRRALDLDRREEQITAMFERTVPLFRRPDMTEQDLEDMMQISAFYTQMAPEAAAARLIRLYDPRDAAGILYYMAERSAAAILAEMEPSFAAELTEILLYS